MHSEDTIVAISTPPGRSGIGVVRLSGKEALGLVRHLMGHSATKDGERISLETCNEPAEILPTERKREAPAPIGLAPRYATRVNLIDPALGLPLDEAVLTYFKAPHSYSGEDVVEISCHGSPIVLQRVLELLIERGARIADPGEFTLRAFLNGKVDLVQAEAIHDLIQAKTLYQAQVALQQAHGALSKTLAPLKEHLVELISLLEAGIDFAEDDVTFLSYKEIQLRIESLLCEVAPIRQTCRLGRILREGLSLAIIGRPNVGKSSLFNRLLSLERAIVTEVPGTTRDVISEQAQIKGIPLRLVDTAGIRESRDTVEREGVARAYAALAESDLILLVFDASQGWDPGDESLVHEIQSLEHLIVFNKCDLPARLESPPGLMSPGRTVRVSAKTGDGIRALQDRIFTLASGRNSGEIGLQSVVTSFRHQQLLSECHTKLEGGLAAARRREPHEVLLLDLYAAVRALDTITGATTMEDILGNIFSRFCVGK